MRADDRARDRLSLPRFALTLGNKSDSGRVVTWIRASTPEQARAKAGSILRRMAQAAK